MPQRRARTATDRALSLQRKIERIGMDDAKLLREINMELINLVILLDQRVDCLQEAYRLLDDRTLPEELR
jgi:hypothetical protein